MNRLTKLNLYSVLSDLQQASSIGLLESLINQNLKHQMNISWVKIVFNENQPGAGQHIPSNDYFSNSQPLNIENYPKANVSFIKKTKFKKSEIVFLTKVSNAISINLDRLIKIEYTEFLKQQWDSTFDAISTPLCLTDEKFNILRTNRSYSEQIMFPSSQITGTNAFQAFLGSSEISFKMEKGQSYFTSVAHRQVSREQHDYEIHCQLITQPQQPTHFSNKQYLIMFKDITEQKKMEKQIIESAKMAELGTIGSSIAHELNNPLAGMLSFIQLIKMEMNKDSDLYSDIDEMEKATLRCKEIVENLLGFSRQHNFDEQEEINISDIILQSIKINELQTKTKGIEVKFQPSNSNEFITLGNRNLLTQAIGHLIQESSISLQECMKSSSSFQPVINILISPHQQGCTLKIIDNRTSANLYTPFQSGKSLGVTVAYKIIKDHEAIMELFSQPNMGVEARITFKRPDLLDKRQVFDGEI